MVSVGGLHYNAKLTDDGERAKDIQIARAA
jgi:hypothetical protein